MPLPSLIDPAVLARLLEPIGTVVDAPRFRLVSPITDDEVGAAVMRQLVTLTLGTARWHPSTERQARLVAAGGERATATAVWLYEKWPELFSELGPTR